MVAKFTTHHRDNCGMCKSRATMDFYGTEGVHSNQRCMSLCFVFLKLKYINFKVHFPMITMVIIRRLCDLQMSAKYETL